MKGRSNAFSHSYWIQYTVVNCELHTQRLFMIEKRPRGRLLRVNHPSFFPLVNFVVSNCHFSLRCFSLLSVFVHFSHPYKEAMLSRGIMAPFFPLCSAQQLIGLFSSVGFTYRANPSEKLWKIWDPFSLFLLFSRYIMSFPYPLSLFNILKTQITFFSPTHPFCARPSNFSLFRFLSNFV